MQVQAKQFIHSFYLSSQYILDVIILTQGSQVKLVIIDLDNTKHGVLSSDGIEGIQIGCQPSFPRFPAFSAVN